MLKRFIKIYKRKIAASSIVEVIIALTICMIIFLIAASIIMQSQKSNNIRLKQKAQFMLSNIEISKLESDSLPADGSLRIERTIVKNDTLDEMRRVEFSVFDNLGHRVAQKVMWIKTDQSIANEEN